MSDSKNDWSIEARNERQWPHCTRAGLTVSIHSQYGVNRYEAWVRADDVERLLKGHAPLGPDIPGDIEFGDAG